MAKERLVECRIFSGRVGLGEGGGGGWEVSGRFRKILEEVPVLVCSCSWRGLQSSDRAASASARWPFDMEVFDHAPSTGPALAFPACAA